MKECSESNCDFRFLSELNGLPDYQILWLQEDNGLPVHIKGGTSDVILYRATMTLSGIGERISSRTFAKGWGWFRFNDNKSDYFRDAKVGFTFATVPWPIADINKMPLKHGGFCSQTSRRLNVSCNITSLAEATVTINHNSLYVYKNAKI